MISPHESLSRRQISKLRSQKRVEKTILDYLVAALNPLLIMILVGSLVFFLIQVFYRGEMAGAVRWTMFWFVLAIVLVSRIGIEQSPTHAGVYGACLAAAAWLFLIQTHPAFLLGIVCLSIVWWSAHQLVQDCTLIDDDQDFTHQGLLQIPTKKTAKEPQTISSQQNPASEKEAGGQKQKQKSRKTNEKKEKRASRPPGRRVLYFSLAALPLFGLGQGFAEAGNAGAGRSGFPLLVAYFAAACGLLLSTGFLGMRRYLRQRSIKMPGNIAGSWMIFGAGIGGSVLLLAVFAPRPGAGDAWMEFSGKIDSLIQNASEAAVRFNPAGVGKGREGRESIASRSAVQDTEPPRSPNANADPQSQSGKQPQLSNQGRPENGADTQASSLLAQILKRLLIAAACLAAVLFLCRKRRLLAALVAAFWLAIVSFLRNLWMPFPRRSIPSKNPADAAKKNRLAPFRRFQNPFASGQSERWPPEVLIAYTYEALQSWAKEAGDPDSPEETPVERSRNLARRHPALSPWVLSLGEHYSLLAYDKRIPQATNALFLRKVWAILAVPLPKADGVQAERKTTTPHSSSQTIEPI